jgi:hypothetical protein
MYGVVAYTGRHGLSPNTHIGRSGEIFRAFGAKKSGCGYFDTFAGGARFALIAGASRQMA